MGKMEPIKVLLVDNEEVFREGLAKLLNEQPHIDVVYHCSNNNEAIKKSKETMPDIILMDSQVAEGQITEAIKDIKKLSPEVKVAIIARPGDQVSSLDIIKSGARAFLAKNISAVDLVKSIELISGGRIIISPLFAEKFINEIATSEDLSSKDGVLESILSEREMEVVKLIAEGVTNKEIGERLTITENTVKVHVKNILNKLELRNRQQLAAYAVLQNWVTTVKTNEENETTEVG
jgi:DNA-binding NarL/FixJ family response regulator